MKQTTLLVLVALLATFAGGTSSFAKEHRKVVQDSTDEDSGDTTSSYSSPYNTHHYGLGVACLGLNTTTGIGTAITGVITLDSKSHLQGYVSLPQTAGGLVFSVAGAYKTLLVGTPNFGLHWGGLLDITDNVGSFDFAVAGILGVHLLVPGTTNLFIHFDGGPAFGILSTPAADGTGNKSTNANFSIGAFSALLGMNVFYVF